MQGIKDYHDRKKCEKCGGNKTEYTEKNPKYEEDK